ncbi:helix-turn-helix domain-containing protein [Humibacter sp. RRB41]|uniref:helix-turn-helix domain-containing protein n=1 Tax=Humibacter sp. RRB41 TaxID=2919946 RepID=UPI001FAA3D47|nr:helix-turn-helix transcriptional regulator [Humibacter sp. RRB41]
MADMQDELTVIADRVRGIAAEKRKDQKAVAAVLEISRQSVNQRFLGRIPFTGPELLRLADAWDVDVARFFPARDEQRVDRARAA